MFNELFKPSFIYAALGLGDTNNNECTSFFIELLKVSTRVVNDSTTNDSDSDSTSWDSDSDSDSGVYQIL